MTFMQLVSAIATAFKLIVVPNEISRRFPYPDAVFLDLKAFSCRSDVMKSLFPRRAEASHDQPTTLERNMTSIVMHPVICNEGKKAIVKSSEMASETASSSSSENGNLKINWDLIGEISSQEPKNVESLLRKKVELEEHIKFTTSAVSRLIEQKSHSGEDKDFPYAASHLIADLTSLSAWFPKSEYDSTAIPVIHVLLERMEKRRPQIDKLLRSLNEIDVSQQRTDSTNRDGKDSKTEDSKLWQWNSIPKRSWMQSGKRKE